MIDSRNSAEKTESTGQKAVAMRKERAGGVISNTQVLGFWQLYRFYWHTSCVTYIESSHFCSLVHS